MKKLVNVQFTWKEGFVMTSDHLTYLLTTKIGSLPLEREIRLFPDERGYYAGDENPPVFMNNLEVAKKRVEKRLLSQMKNG